MIHIKVREIETEREDHQGSLMSTEKIILKLFIQIYLPERKLFLCRKRQPQQFTYNLMICILSH